MAYTEWQSAKKKRPPFDSAKCVHIDEADTGEKANLQ